MEILAYLAGVTVRSLCLLISALVALYVFRARAAAVRHAVLTVTAACMLLLLFLTPVLPPLPLRLLPAKHASLALPATAGQMRSGVAVGAPALASRAAIRLPAVDNIRTSPAKLPAALYVVVALVFLYRLFRGYAFTYRLVRAARPVGEVYESDWITVPMTVGFLRSKILLPTAWKSWEPTKLEAVLTHERMHIRRADWAIAALAALNRCAFWFNPQAWWLERRLASLAEQACDDAALLTLGSREGYAETLLEISAAAQMAGGRLNWEAMAMTRASEVRVRIERILDDARQIPQGLTRARWAVLASCGLVAACLSAALEIAPALAQQLPPESGLMTRMLQWRTQPLPPEEAARLENVVGQNPEDIESRARLIMSYLVTANNPPRIAHVLWLIEHHPESEAHQAGLLFGESGPLADTPSFDQAAALWQKQAEAHSSDSRVVLNAADFLRVYYFKTDPFRAEQWMKRAAEINPTRAAYLGGYYAGVLARAAISPGSQPDSDFAPHARAALDSSTDGLLLWNAGMSLSPIGGVLTPVHAELASYGDQLKKRATALGYQPPALPTSEQINRARSAQQEAYFGPTPVKRVEPAYPPLAAQARIRGNVLLRVLISESGAVLKTEVVSGHPLLRQAVQDAVKQWVYPPQQTETLIQVAVPFP